ncbi:hypothetical protein B4U80_13076 [Leptotrombidium deliense]|uniref:Uncharacterized protein n=1 Tax=Leptotrombidium deliense TaxID=299467 RepID=A0A443SD28_9ACAR|nr:hypothetical protein B4U80_13076 [Leptotrombidium deliense]
MGTIAFLYNDGNNSQALQSQLSTLRTNENYKEQAESLRLEIAKRAGTLQKIVITAIDILKERGDVVMRKILENLNQRLEQAKSRADKILKEPATSEMAIKTLNAINQGLSNVNALIQQATGYEHEMEMNEKQIVEEINRVKKEKLECCECLDDLRRKWFENDKKQKECEERRKLLLEKLTCLQRLKDDLLKRSNQLLKDENGINLIKQLRVVRKGEKDLDSQIEKTKIELNDAKEKCKYFVAKSNEVRKLIKHMQIANEKLSEKIDRILDDFDAFEAKMESDILQSFEHKDKRQKTENSSTTVDCEATKCTVEEMLKINFQKECLKEEPMRDEDKCLSQAVIAQTEMKKEVTFDTITTVAVAVETTSKEANNATSTSLKQEKCESNNECMLSSDKDNTQLAVVSSVNGDKVNTNKWDVTTRDITVVRIVNNHVYVGCINGVIKRVNPADSEDTISYLQESFTNKRVKSLFISEKESLLFSCFDDGFICCFHTNTAQYVSDYRLKSYVVVCDEAWGEIIAARGDKFITFLSMTSDITQLRKISVKGRFQSIIALQPLEENGIRQLLVLGKGWKPIIVNAVTGEYIMAIANQAIYSPAFVVLSDSIICTAFTQTPDSLKYKDSILSFYNVSKVQIKLNSQKSFKSFFSFYFQTDFRTNKNGIHDWLCYGDENKWQQIVNSAIEVQFYQTFVLYNK